MGWTDVASWNASFAALWADMGMAAFWAGVIQIIWIDILLAGDNAVVIALACRKLPRHLRMWGMVLGAGVAILMRILFTVAVVTLMTVPYLKIVGGLALLYIAVKLLMPDENGGKEGTVAAGERLWQAVRIIAVADVVMSLDNVIAIAAASKGHAALFVFGLAASVPLIVAGARLVLMLLTRYPVIVWAGGALLGWIAGQTIVTDPASQAFLTRLFGPGVWEPVGVFGAALLPLPEIVAVVTGALAVVGAGGLLRRRAGQRPD
jgi:YjbE family integral membrane protein